MYQLVHPVVDVLDINQGISFLCVPKGRRHKVYLYVSTIFPPTLYASFHGTIPLLQKNYLDMQLNN